MSTWKEVGEWLKSNAMGGANLVGSLLTGNIPNAIASGVSLISGATGYAEPDKALNTLQKDPQALLRLKELAYQNESSIRSHILEIKKIELLDEQASHKETQETIRAGDKAEDRLIRWTRPGLCWAGIFLSAVYIMHTTNPSDTIFFGLMTLPYSYMGLRQIGKGIDAFVGKGEK
jgi:hypothetical protein